MPIFSGLTNFEPQLIGPCSCWRFVRTGLIVLVCYLETTQSAIPMQSEGVETKHVALSINVLMWRYSGLFPPPFRLGFHIGRGVRSGNNNKHSNDSAPSLVLYYSCNSLLSFYSLQLKGSSSKNRSGTLNETINQIYIKLFHI